jgi:fatty acid desaturase
MVRRFGFWSFPFFIFPGVYLFTWVGYLMHESWHKYVPNVNNGFFYNAFALMLLTDPQLYRMTHGLHHAQVHTHQDAEFHPLGRIENRAVRVAANWLEFILGVAFLVSMSSVAMLRDPRFEKKYRFWKLPASLACWAVFLGGIGTLSHLAFGVTLSQIAIPWIASYWFNSFILHQSQLVEHGNLYVDGTFQERNIRTRNLKPSGPAEKIFLFFTHGDSQEHVLHHTLPGEYLRPFRGVVPLPAGAVQSTLKDYLKIAGRMLAGREDHMEARRDPQRA